jgi:hypothetical protein
LRGGTGFAGTIDRHQKTVGSGTRDATAYSCPESRSGATSEDVVEVIFTVATDGTDQLRYAATEDIKPLVAARL